MHILVFLWMITILLHEQLEAREMTHCLLVLLPAFVMCSRHVTCAMLLPPQCRHLQLAQSLARYHSIYCLPNTSQQQNKRTACTMRAHMPNPVRPKPPTARRRPCMKWVSTSCSIFSFSAPASRSVEALVSVHLFEMGHALQKRPTDNRDARLTFSRA